MHEESRIVFNTIWQNYGRSTHSDQGFQRFQEEWFFTRFKLSRKELKKLLKGKKVLEVGTGSGAFQRVLKDADESIGIDISDEGIAIAMEMWKNQNNVRFIKTDLQDPSFIMKFRNEFDVVVADQVLHHLPNTFDALRDAVTLLKKDGCIMFYVYKKKSLLREFMDDFLRFFTTKIPEKWCLSFSKFLMAIGFNLSMINLRLQRWVYWNMVKCFWNWNWTYENMLKNIFDWYRVPIVHRHTYEEVSEWLQALCLKPESIDRSERAGISVRAIKQ